LGVSTCINYAWGECTANCPVQEITISSSDEGRNYMTCDDTISIPINYSSPEGSTCNYKINTKPYALIKTSITALLEKTRFFLV